jgi:hypothetical protein
MFIPDPKFSIPDPGSKRSPIRSIAFKFISPIKVLSSQKYEKRFSSRIQVFSIPDAGSTTLQEGYTYSPAVIRTNKRRELYLVIAYVLQPIMIRKRPYL